MSDERPDKCPTCGIAREHDGPHYHTALKQAGKPMCPDPFHDPAPKPQGLDAVSGDGTWDEADERYAAAINAPSPDKVRGILRDEVVTVDGEPHIPLEVANRRSREADKKLAAAEAALIEAKRELSGYKLTQSQLLYERDVLRSQLTTLREAVEACAEALGAWEMSSKPSDPTIAQGLLRAGDKARRALASLDEQGGSDE